MAAAASVVVGFVHGDGALLPIGRGFHPVFAQPALVNEMPAQRLGGRCLARRPRHSRRRAENSGRATASAAAAARALRRPRRRRAMQPDRTSSRARVSKRCSSPGVGDFDDDESTRTRRQLLQAAADGRQRRLVAGEKIPVEIVGHDERAARTADAEEISGPRLRRPGRRRAIAVQHEIDRQRLAAAS